HDWCQTGSWLFAAWEEESPGWARASVAVMPSTVSDSATVLVNMRIIVCSFLREGAVCRRFAPGLAPMPMTIHLLIALNTQALCQQPRAAAWHTTAPVLGGLLTRTSARPQASVGHARSRRGGPSAPCLSSRTGCGRCPHVIT